MSNGLGCVFEGCPKPLKAKAKRLCGGHYAQHQLGRQLTPLAYRPPNRPSGTLCSFPRCGRKHFSRGLCAGHNAHRAKGEDLRPLRVYAPRGSGSINGDGYRLLRGSNHPNARANGEILEHVLVMSDLLGRPLRDKENVHHKNGVRDDNRPENLELWTTSQPQGQRVSDKIDWCREFLAQYEAEEGAINP